MVSAAAWVALPVVFLLLAGGVGLLAERAARLELPRALLAPLGASIAVCLVSPVYRLGGPPWAAALLLVALALGGLLVSRRALAARLRPDWPHLGLALAFALYLAPVVLSGGWTWLGYNFVNDTANNMLFAEHVAEHGYEAPEGPPSTTTAILQAAFGSHYPLGMFAVLATLKGIVPVPVEALYQPVIAVLAGLAATSLAVVARAAGLRGPWTGLVGALAAGASLTYAYALHGAIKEIAFVMVLATAAALIRAAIDARWAPSAFALTGITLAAGLTVFSAAAAPYAGLAGAFVLLAFALERARPPVRRLAAGAALATVGFVVAALPTLAEALSFLTSTAPAFRGEGGIHGQNSTVIFGHLVRPLPAYQALGIWPSDDYRFPIVGPRWPLTIAAMILVATLIAIAVAVELRRRRLATLLLLLPAVATYLIAAPRITPYADAKLLLILSPAAVLAAGAGAWHVARRVRWAGLAAGAALATGVLVSDALAYHSVRLAPTDRMRSLVDVTEHATQPGPWLHNEWEEFSKYFERDIVNYNATESFTPAPVVLREDAPMFAQSFDLDQQVLEYVETFPGLILRRSPSASRPPANFVRTYANEHYELWRRRPGPRVIEHLSLQATNDATLPPACTEVRRLARHLRPGQKLIGAQRPEPAVLDVTRPRGRPIGWNPSPVPGLVVPGRPGRVEGRLVTGGGRHDIWVRGSTGRKLHVTIDGRPAGSVVGVNTPGQWLHAGTADLRPGRHRVALTRPGGSLAPGDGYAGEIGPVALVPRAEPRLIEAGAGNAEQRLCGRSLDWIERVAG